MSKMRGSSWVSLSKVLRGMLGGLLLCLISGILAVQAATFQVNDEPVYIPLILGGGSSQQNPPVNDLQNVPIGLVLRGPAENEIEFLNQHLLENDLVLQGLFRGESDLALLDQITACQRGVGLPANFEGDPSPLLAQAKAKGILLVAYDLEGHLGLSIDEIVARQEAMYGIVSRYDLTFMFGTRMRAIERHYEAFVPYTDAIVVQAQNYQGRDDYQTLVTDLVNAIREAKPGIMVWVQVSVNPTENPQITAQEVLEDIYQITEVADGIFIYYEPERWQVARQVIEQLRPLK